jgi:DNA repair protein RadC
MATTDGHKGTGHRGRLRERFLAAGLEGFHDYEVVELLLTLATPRKDCKAAAKAAMARFGNLPAVLEASAARLCRVPGIGSKNLLGIHLVRAVADRYLKARLDEGEVLNNSGELFDYLYSSMRDKSRESFQAVFLDAKNRVIEVRTLFTGTLTASAVYPREVVRAALDRHAAAVIFAHNHPSGDPEPSADDVALTRQLVYACKMMGITVHEHIVIGRNRYYSFADRGRIAAMHRDFETRFGDDGRRETPGA